jgi:hypothetical protein
VNLIALDWIGLNWIGLDCIAFNLIRLPFDEGSKNHNALITIQATLPILIVATLPILEDWIALHCIGLDRIALHWIELDRIGSHCIGLDCIALDWIALDWHLLIKGKKFQRVMYLDMSCISMYIDFAKPKLKVPKLKNNVSQRYLLS